MLQLPPIRRSGFTLVELLVVLSIIAVLVAMLIPAISQAKKQSRLAVCMSNQRQHAIAFYAYASDWNQWFPICSKNTSQWMTALAPYVLGTSVPSTWTGNLDLKIPVYRCPETRDLLPYTAGSTVQGRCYGINFTLTQGRPDLPTPNLTYRRQHNTIRCNPAALWLSSDHAYYTAIGWSSMTGTARVPGDPLYIQEYAKSHDGSVNMLFVDGHVLNLREGQRTDLMCTDGNTFGW